MQTLAAPVPNSPTPWGPAQHTGVLADGIICVETASHGGIWLSQARLEQVPDGIAPLNGRSWYEEDCEWALAFVLFDDVKDRERHLGTAIQTLATWNPDWLYTIAIAAGVPSCAQIAKITHLWDRFEQPGKPDLAQFRARPGSSTGFVEGQIGPVWFGISPDGEAHS